MAVKGSFMKKLLDARKLECPKPILETQKILKDAMVTEVEVIVDNITARENLKRFAGSAGFSYDVKEKDKDEYAITISRSASAEDTEKNNVQVKAEGTTYLILSDELGKGDPELGRILMKGFLYTLTQTSPLPDKLILLNSAVRLSTVNDETVDHLKVLENSNVEIYSCGTCLNFYNLADSLRVGVIGNMYDVVEAISQKENKISVG